MGSLARRIRGQPGPENRRRGASPRHYGVPVQTEWEQRWATAQWRDEATAWADAALRARGISRTGDVEQPRLRTWSTALTLPTDVGLFWFKENCPGLSSEAAVVAALTELAPERVVAPLAVDAARGWMLTADHGQTLREAGRNDLATWVRVVEDYADLQRGTVEHGATLREAGIAVLESQDVAGYVEAQLAKLSALPEGHPRYVDPVLLARVHDVLPQLEKLGAVLAAGPVPLALDHNDLHDNNAFVPTEAETTLRFFDFGDALWAHPFGSMLIVLNVVTDPGGLDLDEAAVTGLLDAYLGRWTDLAPLAELHELLDAALVLGRVHRYLSWDRSFVGAPPEALGGQAQSPALWLQLLAESLEPGGSPRVL